VHSLEICERKLSDFFLDGRPGKTAKNLERNKSETAWVNPGLASTLPAHNALPRRTWA
jgi:hypothetical protein